MSLTETPANPIVAFIRNFVRRQAIRGAVKRVGRQLRRDWGHGAPYSPDAVKAAAADVGVAAGEIPYVVAFFCSAEAATGYRSSREHARARKEAGEACFGSGDSFGYDAVDSYCADGSGDVGSCDASGDGGSDGGGGDGGGGGGGD